MAPEAHQLTDPLIDHTTKGTEHDLKEIRSINQFLKEAHEENKRLWALAGPAIFTAIAQYSLGAVTQVFAGHMTTVELDAVSIENSVIAGLAFGIMLGAGRPKAAQFSILVVLMSSVALGILSVVLVLALRDVYGVPFTNNPEVANAVSSLAFAFAVSLFLNCIQPVLTGVAVGAGWQWLIAYVNLGCYYLFGLPLGYLLGFTLDKGILGMWTGQMVGVGLQTTILIFITWRTNWDYEASQASARIQKWGGSAKTTEDYHSSKSELVA